MMLATQEVSHSQKRSSKIQVLWDHLTHKLHFRSCHLGKTERKKSAKHFATGPSPTQVFMQAATAGTMKDKATLDVGSVTNLTLENKRDARYMMVITGTSSSNQVRRLMDKMWDRSWVNQLGVTWWTSWVSPGEPVGWSWVCPSTVVGGCDLSITSMFIYQRVRHKG